MECTDKHEKKELISHLGIVSEQMVTVISLRVLSFIILPYFIYNNISWSYMSTIEDFLLFSVRNDKTSPYIHHEGKSCIGYELQPLLECQRTVALNLL